MLRCQSYLRLSCKLVTLVSHKHHNHGKIDGQTFTSIGYLYSSEEQRILESRNVDISVVSFLASTFDRSPHFYGDAEQPPDAKSFTQLNFRSSSDLRPSTQPCKLPFLTFPFTGLHAFFASPHSLVKRIDLFSYLRVWRN